MRARAVRPCRAGGGRPGARPGHCAVAGRDGTGAKAGGARDALAAARKHRDDLLAEAEQLRRRLQDTERELRPAEAAVRSAERRLHEREQR